MNFFIKGLYRPSSWILLSLSMLVVSTNDLYAPPTAPKPAPRPAPAAPKPAPKPAPAPAKPAAAPAKPAAAPAKPTAAPAKPAAAPAASKPASATTTASKPPAATSTAATKPATSSSAAAAKPPTASMPHPTGSSTSSSATASKPAAGAPHPAGTSTPAVASKPGSSSSSSAAAKPGATSAAHPDSSASSTAASKPGTATKPGTPSAAKPGATSAKEETAATKTGTGDKAAATAAKPGEKTAAKPGAKPAAKPGAAASTATDDDTPAPAKPSMASRLGGLASMAGGLASNPLVSGLGSQALGMAVTKVTGNADAGAMVSGAAQTAAAAHASGENPLAAVAANQGAQVAGAVVAKATGNENAGALVAGLASSAAGATTPVNEAAAPVEGDGAAAVDQPAASEEVAAVVDTPAADTAPADIPPTETPVEDGAALATLTEEAAAVADTPLPAPAVVTKQPTAGGAKAPVVAAAKVVAAAPKVSSVIGAFVKAVEASLKVADFDTDVLKVTFTANGAATKISIPLGGKGFGDAKKAFEAQSGAFEGAVAVPVKAEVEPLLKLAPVEVFAFKLILMLNGAKKAVAADFDTDDFILVNLPMLLHRLEMTDGAYAKSSRAAFDAIRAQYKPLLALIEFPDNPWYNRVMTDMPGGEPTSFMRALSKIRWESGHKERTKMFADSVLPQLTASRSPLEKAYFAYAFSAHLDEYDGGFVKSDSDDFIKRVIESRFTALEPVLKDAVVKMKAADVEAEAVTKAEEFLSGLATKPRTAGADAEPLVPLQMPAVPVTGLGSGVDYFVKIVDPYIRTQILHRAISGEAKYVYFDFAYDADQAKEAVVALAARVLQGLVSTEITEELTDIYYRADDTVVDDMLARLKGIPGYEMNIIQSATEKAKKAVNDREEEDDDIVMDDSDL